MSETGVATLQPHLQRQVESAQAAQARGEWRRAAEGYLAVLQEAPECLAVRLRERVARLAATRSRRGAWRAVAGACGAGWAGWRHLARDPRRAAKRATKLLAGEPRNAAALRLLGAAADALGWRETAVFAYAARRELVPENAKNLLALGRALLAGGRAQAAVEVAGEALRLHPQDARAAELLRAAAVAGAVQAGGWGQAGDFRGKLRR